MKQKAFFLESKQGQFVVRERDVPKPGKGQLLIKVLSAALNPVDWKIQQTGAFVDKYPAVLGIDMAGQVEEVGEGVQRFAKGDQILSHGEFNNDQATFQQYAIATEDYTCKIPPNMNFDQAASVPLGLDTAAIGLYSKQLGAGLVPPWVEGGKGKYSGKPILILGGASSVGSYTIQLAKLSGFTPIISTASRANKKDVEALGATHVIDRHVTEDEFTKTLDEITQQPIEIAYDAISMPKTQQAGWSALAQGGTLVLSLQPFVKEEDGKGRKIITTYGSPHAQPNQAMCREYWSVIEKWLKDGVIKPNKVEVLPSGLNGIVGGFERMRESKVSGVKLVVHPQDTV